MSTIQSRPTITIDGVLTDWIANERIDYGDVAGATFYGAAQAGNFNFALVAPTPIGANTTFWFDTDRNPATGYQIFGFAGGAEYNVNIRSDGTAALYTGGAGETLVLDNIPIAWSADHTVVEFAIPKVALGDPESMNVLYDVNDTLFGPANYSATPYVAYNDDLVRTNPAARIGIVFSQTTANNYFSKTAYAQLVMAVESQAMQAGIPFDLLTEADLTDPAKLANYDALIFPSMANVPASQVAAITDALLEVTKLFGVGLIAAGNFLTNDENGAPLPGDSYARMKLLFDATRVTGGFPADVALTAGPGASSVFTTLSPGDPIYNYTQVPWDAFQSVSGTGQTIVSETVNGQSYAAALATQTGGRNVLFSTPSVMADNNLLWQAINHVAKPAGIQVGLALSRFSGIVAPRIDMDQSQYLYDVTPDEGGPGIYDRLLPIITQWKQDYNFVGSFYVNIGDDPVWEEQTNWAISAPYYAQLLALGNELGTHSYTHPLDTNALTPAQMQFEFEQSKQVLEQQMSAYLGRPFTVTGAAVPGADETVDTARQIIQYFDYMTGGFSGRYAGYPGAFGFLGPDLTDKVYLAPDTSFDFTLVDFKHMDPATFAATWAKEWNDLLANAQMPIVLWPIHDYGPTAWPTDPPNPSEYADDGSVFTDWVARAYNSGAEFVTGADLASRIESFYHSGVTSTVNGNVIDVTVTSPHAGEFALDLAGLGSQVISSVAGWYAYDSDSLFLPDGGGSFSITTGAAAADVTHIVALPMRANLLSLTGNGLDLDFSVFGEGTVRIDLGQFGTDVPIVSGATITGLTADQLDITLGGIGLHNVSLTFGPAPVVTAVALSADSGASATDFITNIAPQTISGTLSNALPFGAVVRLSLDNGATWRDATATAGATTFSATDVTLGGSGTLLARVERADGVAGEAHSQAYMLDQQAPTETVAITSMTNDGGTTGDFITNDGAAGRTVSGTLSSALAADEMLRVSFDGGASWGAATVAGTAWSIVDPASHAAGWTITAQLVDLAGNAGPLVSQTVTLDKTPPARPSRPALAAGSDTGASATDNLTNDATPSFTGTRRCRQHRDPVRWRGRDRLCRCRGEPELERHRLGARGWRAQHHRDCDRCRRQCQPRLGGPCRHDRYRGAGRTALHRRQCRISDRQRRGASLRQPAGRHYTDQQCHRQQCGKLARVLRPWPHVAHAHCRADRPRRQCQCAHAGRGRARIHWRRHAHRHRSRRPVHRRPGCGRVRLLARLRSRHHRRFRTRRPGARCHCLQRHQRPRQLRRCAEPRPRGWHRGRDLPRFHEQPDAEQHPPRQPQRGPFQLRLSRVACRNTHFRNRTDHVRNCRSNQFEGGRAAHHRLAGAARLSRL